MGRSVIRIVVTGNHGCNRKAKEGEPLGEVCKDVNCIDCTARRFVHNMMLRQDVEEATHTHWPDDDNGGIVDDLKTQKRVKNDFFTSADGVKRTHSR